MAIFDTECRHSFQGPMTRDLKIRPNMHRHESIPNAGEVQKLVIEFNSSSHIFAGIGESFSNLELLWCHGKLQFIERRDFSQLEKLKTLILSWNPIRFYSEEVFWDLKNIENLYLDNCELEAVPRNLFLNSKKLRNLRLDSNYIRTIESDLFRNNLKLESVNFSFNYLRKVDYDFSNLNAINMTSSACINATFFVDNLRASTVRSTEEFQTLVRQNCNK